MHICDTQKLRESNELKSQQNVLCHFGNCRGGVVYCLKIVRIQYIVKASHKILGGFLILHKMQNFKTQYKSQMNQSLQMTKMFAVALICVCVC